MRRIRITGIAVATALVAGAAWAPGGSAHFESPQILPDVPGVGNPEGMFGPGPHVSVYGGPVRLRPERTIQVELRCTSSTEAGCRGALELADRAGRHLASADLDLYEGQAEGVLLELPAGAKRRAARPKGWKLRALASVTDSLGRSATDAAGVTVRVRRADRRR